MPPFRIRNIGYNKFTIFSVTNCTIMPVVIPSSENRNSGTLYCLPSVLRNRKLTQLSSGFLFVILMCRLAVRFVGTGIYLTRFLLKQKPSLLNGPKKKNWNWIMRNITLLKIILLFHNMRRHLRPLQIITEQGIAKSILIGNCYFTSLSYW